MVWGKAGSTTTTSTGDTITVSGMTASESNVIMLHKINSGNVNPLLTFNSDSGSNYAWRYNNNGGTDATVVNGTKLEMAVTGTTPTLFNIFYSVNVSTEEKLLIGHTVEQNTAGAGTAPQRMEVVSKWANTSDQITTVSFGNDAAGDYAIDSNVSVIGSDITPADAIPFPTNVQVGSRAEITDTRKMYDLYDPTTNVLYEDATGQSNTSSHGTVVFIGDNATYATLFSRIAATNTTHPHPAVNVDTPNKAFSSSDPWTIELTFKESYTIPSGSTITYNSYNNGQGARLKYLDFQVYTGSTWENITGTITNPNHSDGDVETTSGRWVKYMTSTTTTEKTGTKFRIRMWDSWDNYVANGRHYIGGIELKIPIGNVAWQEIGA